jgi:serine/threonine protein kinase
VLLEGSDENAMRYFCNEARLLAHLRHPNIVGVVDCGVMENGVYIVMEWLPGHDLGTYLATNGPLSPKRALWILRQLASALDYVHRKGIVHRDIKPENVIFHPEAYDAVKLFDFGVAVPFLTPPASEDNKVIGTPLYMAPEQAAGCPSTPSTDLYALGALALELLTGQAAYARQGASEILAAVITRPPSLPSDHGLHIPGLDEVLAKAMARDPKDRFSTGLEFVRALRAVLIASGAETPSVPPRPAPPAPPCLKPTLWSERQIPRLEPDPLPPRRRPTASPSTLGVLTACCCALAAWLLAPL